MTHHESEKLSSIVPPMLLLDMKERNSFGDIANLLYRLVFFPLKFPMNKSVQLIILTPNNFCRLKTKKTPPVSALLFSVGF